MIVFTNRRGCGCGGCVGAIVLLFFLFFLLSALGSGVTGPNSPGPRGPVNINPPTSTPTGSFGLVVRARPHSVERLGACGACSMRELASPAGLEPTLPAPEAGALSN